MSFLTLDALTLAGRIGAVSAATAAVGVLVAMYFLKLKRQRKEISSTFLWKKSVEDLRANSPFQRLRRNLLLFLQLLILIAALLALGRPALAPTARTGVSFVVLVDVSASMNSTDVSPNRLSVALDRLKSVVDDMNQSDQMMILTFGAHPRVVAGLTGDRSALYAAIRGIAPEDTATDVAEPLELAESLARTLANPRIKLLSDGAFGKGAGIPNVSAPLEYICVGSGGDNVGITAMDVRRSIEDPSTGEVFTKITNFSPAPVTVNVSLMLDSQLADASARTIAAGSSEASVFRVRLDAERVAQVVIDSPDSLEADNRAWAVLEPARKIRAIVVGQANTFLTTALSSGAGFEVSQAPTAEIIGAADTEIPVFIFDGSAPASLGRAGYLIFNAVAPAEGFKQLGELKNPVILDVDTSNPIAAFLDLGDLFIEKAMKMSFPPETKVLVTGDEGPLVALSFVGPARILTVAFDPLDSRWPLRISYPMFVSNAVNYLASGGRLSTSRQFAAGEVLVLAPQPGVTEVSVRDPAGRKTVLQCEPDRSVSYGQTARAGVYMVASSGGDAAGREAPYVANLTSPVESDIRPMREFQAGSAKVLATAVVTVKNREIWRELLVLAFVVLLVEWYIYNRRVYV